MLPQVAAAGPNGFGPSATEGRTGSCWRSLSSRPSELTILAQELTHWMDAVHGAPEPLRHLTTRPHQQASRFRVIQLVASRGELLISFALLLLGAAVAWFEINDG